jgi:hypothetical protein
LDEADHFFNLHKELFLKYFKEYVKVSDEEIILTIPIEDSEEEEDEEIIYILKKEDVINGFSKIEIIEAKMETSIISPYYYEILINSGYNTFRPVYAINKKIIGKEKVDKHNGLTYVISPISKQFLFNLFSQLNDEQKLTFFSSLVENTTAIMLGWALNETEKKISPDLLDIIIYSNRKLLSLKITSEKFLKYGKYNQLADAFIFNTSYNLDFPITKYTHISDLILRKRLFLGRKTEYDELDIPKKVYIPDLIYHYENALSTDNPHLQFISYYHIIEYFYNDVYNRHLINKVRQTITDPSFSSIKNESIDDLVKVIQKNLKNRDAEYEYDEMESLRLTLKEYIDLDKLINSLTEYNSKSLKHYNKPVSFLGKYGIDFVSTKEEIKEENKKRYAQVATRIYKVRNSVVHSKKGDKAICLPVKHDRDLSLEIPLVRLVAEQIIINSSELLNFDDT